MQLPLEIDYRNVPSSVPIDALIHRRAAKLSRRCARLIGCQVTVELAHRHHRHGNAYQVHIRLVVPASVVVVSHGHEDPASQDLYAAIRAAFDSAEQQLEEWKRKHRRHVEDRTTQLQGAG